MELLDNRLVVSEIVASVFVPFGKGKAHHKCRHAHGLAINIDCSSTFRFESGEVIRCNSGECIYLPHGSSYTVENNLSSSSGENSGTYAINFMIYEKDGAKYLPQLFHIKGFDEILSCFSRSEWAWRRRAADYHEECMISIYRIIRLLRKEREKYSPIGRTLDILSPAIDYINENYTEGNIPLPKLAELCGISEVYLRRLFQSAFSASPAVYMRNMRIKYAKRLLRSGECSVTDAAMLSGFGDPAYFSREFKKTEGISPAEYVQKHFS